jgi:hypothetical protein
VPVGVQPFEGVTFISEITVLSERFTTSREPVCLEARPTREPVSDVLPIACVHPIMANPKRNAVTAVPHKFSFLIITPRPSPILLIMGILLRLSQNFSLPFFRKLFPKPIEFWEKLYYELLRAADNNTGQKDYTI